MLGLDIILSALSMPWLAIPAIAELLLECKSTRLHVLFEKHVIVVLLGFVSSAFAGIVKQLCSC